MARTEPVASRLLHEVPLLHGLTPAEMKAFVDICKLSSLARGGVLCEVGTASNRMFVLLEGELEVVGPENTMLATVKPVSVVGEMGFITRRARSATLRARSEVRVLNVDFHDFEALAEANPVLRAKVYRNLIRVLADRLSDANDLVARYRKSIQADGSPLASATAGATPAGGASAVRPAAVEDEEAGVKRVLNAFYLAIGATPDQGQQAEDRILYLQLRRDGYTEADIEYAAKWASRNIPSIQRFNLVKLSIGEAFRERWSG